MESISQYEQLLHNPIIILLAAIACFTAIKSTNRIHKIPQQSHNQQKTNVIKYSNEIANQLHSLYNTTISFANTEKQIIWSRFIAFNVLNGFIIQAIVHFITEAHNKDYATLAITIIISTTGIIFNVVWITITYRGWNHLYRHLNVAANIFTEPNMPTLLTDWHKIQSTNLGYIYSCAQTPPITFTLLYVAATGYTLHNFHLSPTLTIALPLIEIIVISVGISLNISLIARHPAPGRPQSPQ